MPSSPGLCGAEKWHFEAMQPVGLEDKNYMKVSQSAAEP